jgi:hypothetical protein
MTDSGPFFFVSFFIVIYVVTPEIHSFFSQTICPGFGLKNIVTSTTGHPAKVQESCEAIPGFSSVLDWIQYNCRNRKIGGEGL